MEKFGFVFFFSGTKPTNDLPFFENDNPDNYAAGGHFN
jgi:hypothetical protein